MRKLHGVIPFVLIAVGVGILVFVLSSPPIEEGRCALRRKATGNPRENQLAALAWQPLEPQLSRPNDVQDSPQGFTRPCFYGLETKEGRLAVALDLSCGRLCLDTDRDGLFSDEHCFGARSVKLARRADRQWRFGPVRWSADGGQEAAVFYAPQRAVDQPAFLSPYPAYYRSGRLRLQGNAYTVAVMDGDYDGRFGSVVSLPAGFGAVAHVPPENQWRVPRCDLFAIDKDRDGNFECSLYGSSEVMPLSKLVLLGDRYYTLDVSADGSGLALTPAEPTCGRLAIEPANAQLQLRLWSDAVDQSLSRAVGPWDLPVGAYQTLYAVVTLQDANGDHWTFSTLREVGELASFQIQPGETTRLRVGPPFVVKADVERIGPRTVSITPILVGCGGEQYRADCERNYRRAPERPFQIVDEKGSVLAADKFQYG
jgi:hypothetical protein